MINNKMKVINKNEAQIVCGGNFCVCHTPSAESKGMSVASGMCGSTCCLNLHGIFFREFVVESQDYDVRTVLESNPVGNLVNKIESAMLGFGSGTIIPPFDVFESGLCLNYLKPIVASMFPTKQLLI
jgi:hypothetical protein